MEPTRFVLVQSRGTLSSLAGLALVGQAPHRFAQLPQLVNPSLPVRSGIPNSYILMPMVGLLCQGKSDFGAIERFLQDGFFARALGLRGVPPVPTLRQQLDRHAEVFLPMADTALTQLLKKARVPITPLPCGYVPLGLDVFTLDNSTTCKEGIGWTYAGFIGYAPIAAYLGQEGWDTTLPERLDPQAVIALYADHATHEQFHAEIKTDLDLERLPCRKFATNDLLLTLGALAYNILRMIGQKTLQGPDATPPGQAATGENHHPGDHHPGGPRLKRHSVYSNPNLSLGSVCRPVCLH